MGDWSSNQYLKFQRERTQPAEDLASRLREKHPEKVIDLGCGPGNSTAVLRKQFPHAQLLGLDSSSDMIAKAQKAHPELVFQQGKVESLEGRYDLLFSNACFQWIPDHFHLIPRLMDHLLSGGVLAVQMPRNEEEPLYQLIDQMAGESYWGIRPHALPYNRSLAPQEYMEILSDCARDYTVWETTYYHILPDHQALIEWVKGARLRPYLDQMGEKLGAEFQKELVRRAQPLYPRNQKGNVILGFRRLFFTAEK